MKIKHKFRQIYINRELTFSLRNVSYLQGAKEKGNVAEDLVWLPGGGGGLRPLGARLQRGGGEVGGEEEGGGQVGGGQVGGGQVKKEEKKEEGHVKEEQDGWKYKEEVKSSDT